MKNLLVKISKVATVNSLIDLAFRKAKKNLAIFDDLFDYKLEQIKSFDDMIALNSYNLVWCNSNKGDGLRGNWYDVGTKNYTLLEYIRGIKGGNVKPHPALSKIIDSIYRKGLTRPIEIITALDTDIHEGLIIDGTKRAVALAYISMEWPNVFEKLLLSEHSIYELRLESDYCKMIFPCDFLKILPSREEYSRRGC